MSLVDGKSLTRFHKLTNLQYNLFLGCSDRWGSACSTYKSYYGCNYSSIRKGCANLCNACRKFLSNATILICNLDRFQPWSLSIQELFSILARNCEWSSWQEGQCDKTCGGGKRKVSRTKLVQERNGGYCYGRSYKIERCNMNICQSW